MAVLRRAAIPIADNGGEENWRAANGWFLHHLMATLGTFQPHEGRCHEEKKRKKMALEGKIEEMVLGIKREELSNARRWRGGGFCWSP